LCGLAGDPAGSANRAASRVDVVAELRERLPEHEKQSAATGSASAPIEEDEDTLRKLAALGYAGGRRSTDDDRSFKELPDPKDRIDIYNQMNHAREEVQAEHDDAAESVLHDVLRGDPEVIDAYFMLGNIQLKRHRWAEAADFYRKTLEKRPDHDYAMIGLADTLVATGNVDDAVIGYERFLKEDPGNAQIAYR